YKTAEAMHDDLARLQIGKPPRRSRGPAWAYAGAALVLACAAAALWPLIFRPAATHTRSQLTLRSDPPGAMIILGDRLKPAPATFEDAAPARYSARVLLAGY